jgi:uncharacterized protein (TIGR02722 family)
MRIYWALILASLLVAGCGTKVTRIEADETVDLSGAWNDTDSRLVAEEMIADALSHPWTSNFAGQTGRAPAVIIGTVRNFSHEHINMNTFVADIERALINSGRVDFFSSSDDRGEISEEILDNDLKSSEETRNEAGQEAGADFMLKGQINTIVDAQDDEQIRYYQVDLSLISLADNRKVWLGQKKIKKLVENAKVRY